MKLNISISDLMLHKLNYDDKLIDLMNEILIEDCKRIFKDNKYYKNINVCIDLSYIELKRSRIIHDTFIKIGHLKFNTNLGYHSFCLAGKLDKNMISDLCHSINFDLNIIKDIIDFSLNQQKIRSYLIKMSHNKINKILPRQENIISERKKI